MQYILSEEEYQRYQDALKDAEAARSDAAKLDAYAAARDRNTWTRIVMPPRLAPHLARPIAHHAGRSSLKLLADWKRRDPEFYSGDLAQIAGVYEDSAEE